jgi:hypothetical protein
MKRKLFFTTMVGAALVLGLGLLGCPTEDSDGGGGGPAVINIPAIQGVTVPVTGATPAGPEITPTDQYIGRVSWDPAPPATGFAAATVYTATIILTAKDGYTLTGVGPNFFTVAGTSSAATNSVNGNAVTAIFPATAAGGGGGGTAINIKAIAGVTAPVTGAAPAGPAITATDQYTGAVSWNPALPATGFAANTPYTATITLAAKDGYTFNGVTADFFTVAGATTVSNPASSGVVTAIFPATAAAQIGAPTVTAEPSIAKILVSWNEVSGATGYRVVWARADDVPTTPNATNSIELGGDKKAYTISVDVLEEYGIWVQAKGADGTYGDYCARKAVTPRQNAGSNDPKIPAAPTVTPTDNGQLKIVWTDTQWANRYIVKIGTNNQLANNPDNYPDANGIPELEYTTTTLDADISLTYYVWVGAKNDNNTTWSTSAVVGTILGAPATLAGTTWKIQGSSPANYEFTGPDTGGTVTFESASHKFATGSYTYTKPTLKLNIAVAPEGSSKYDEWDNRAITIQGKTFKTGLIDNAGSALDYVKQ